MLTKLRRVLLTVLPSVNYAHNDYDSESNPKPPFIVYQEISKRPPGYADDKPIYYERTIQITLITKKKDTVLEEKLEKALLDNDYVFSLTTDYKNSDGTLNSIYEIRLEDFKHAKK